MVQARWAAVLLLVPALAGCADAEAGGDGPAAPVVQDPLPALAAAITASVDGIPLQPRNATQVDATVAPVGQAPQVEVPLDAVVLFDGSASRGAILTYAWDFGDGATGTNRAEEHAYAAPGLHVVKLTVGNGTAHAEATLAVHVVGTPAGTPLATLRTSFSGELPASNVNSCTVQGVDCRDHAVLVSAEVEGIPAVARAVRINLTGSAPYADVQVLWRSPDGTSLAQTEASGSQHAFGYSGDMPAGEYVVRVRVFIGAGLSYEGTADVDYGTA